MENEFSWGKQQGQVELNDQKTEERITQRTQRLTILAFRKWEMENCGQIKGDEEERKWSGKKAEEKIRENADRKEKKAKS